MQQVMEVSRESYNFDFDTTNSNSAQYYNSIDDNTTMTEIVEANDRYSHGYLSNLMFH